MAQEESISKSTAAYQPGLGRVTQIRSGRYRIKEVKLLSIPVEKLLFCGPEIDHDDDRSVLDSDRQ